MIRSLIAGLLALVAASSTALAQSCTGNPVAVQILGSGAPGFVKDRANTSYLLWIGPQAKILVDAGGGAYVRFGQAGAKFSDLSMILVSHLHPDHVSDLPGVLWSGRMTRSDSLPIIGPSGNEAAPSFSTFLNRNFDDKSGAFQDDFFFQISVFILCMVILGGMGNIWGVIFGACFLAYLDREGLSNIGGQINNTFSTHIDVPKYEFGIFGAIIVIVMLFRPEGLIPSSRVAAELHEGVHDEPLYDSEHAGA